MGIASGYQDFRLDLTGRIREVGLSDAAPENDDDSGDNAASLILSKPLYDFGLQDSREGRIGLQLEALEMQKRLLIEQRRLDILEKYFAVLDADNQFLSENEALAIGYIRYDNAREDQELGATAEIEVLRLQSATTRLFAVNAISPSSNNACNAASSPKPWDIRDNWPRSSRFPTSTIPGHTAG